MAMRGRELAVLAPVGRRAMPRSALGAPPPAPTALALLALGTLLAMLASLASAEAQATVAAPAGLAATVLKWLPLVISGFLFNLLVSALSMLLGTATGVALGLGLVALSRPVRGLSWSLMQFFRNAPWLVLLFYAIFLIPFEVRVLGVTVPFPGWLKAVIGLALPVMANVSEIVRGGILSVPASQWESADALAFSRRRTLWQIVIPQAVKRMIPPWMNLYAILTMATPLIAIVGVQEGLTLTRAALVAEGRPELLIPMYFALLAMFFAYCYPIALLTRALERRFDVKL
jgi:polar amino acid transport system permease protein